MCDLYILHNNTQCVHYQGICELCVCYLGEGVFCDVLVGDVRGLDQLAGDLGVCRVRGLPTGACKTSKGLGFLLQKTLTQE